jgi:hypothetical protein
MLDGRGKPSSAGYHFRRSPPGARLALPPLAVKPVPAGNKHEVARGLRSLSLDIYR